MEAFRTIKAPTQSRDLIPFELSANFDTVNHKVILSALSEMGISSTALD